MKSLARLSALTLGSVALCVGFATAFTSWLDAAPLNLGDVGRMMAREAERCSLLEQRDQIILRSTRGKLEVVEELAAGRMTLAEAASRFRQLQAPIVEHDPSFAAVFPPDQDEEAVCRGVISWVGNVLHDRPACDTVLARLHRELRQQFPHSGARAL